MDGKRWILCRLLDEESFAYLQTVSCEKVRLIDNATKPLGLSAQHEVCNVRTEPHVVYPSPDFYTKKLTSSLRTTMLRYISMYLRWEVDIDPQRFAIESDSDSEEQPPHR